MGTTSPTPKKKPEETIAGPVLMNFPQAMQAVIDGKTITKLSWNDTTNVCKLRNGLLSLRRIKEGDTELRWHIWHVNDGDMAGTDWVITSDPDMPPPPPP